MSVPVFDVLLWLFEDVVLDIGKEVVLVMLFSLLPALLDFAFPQLFLIVRITLLPGWHSFKDFLLLLFFPIVGVFCQFKFFADSFCSSLFISLTAGNASADLLFTKFRQLSARTTTREIRIFLTAQKHFDFDLF